MREMHIALVSISSTVNNGNYWGTLAKICSERFLMHAELVPRTGPEFGHVKPHVTLAHRDRDESELMDVISYKREHIEVQ